MRQARALPLPNEALHIEEIKFWLKIMQEHAGFIGAGLPPEAADFISASKEFQRAFSSLLQRAERLKSVKQAGAFLGEVSDVTEEFCRCQREILSQRLTGRMESGSFPFFLDHLLREAKCFMDFLRRMQEGKAAAKTVSHTREVVIWLRFMADHARLFAHYIDPSECRMGKMTAEFIALFDELAREGRDLSSMLYGQRGEVRAFHRFLLDVRSDVQRLRDFHKMAEELIADCRLLGVVSVALAAHMKREAEHCLLRIALLEKDLLKHCPELFQDDIDADVWTDTERTDAAPSAEAVPLTAEMAAVPREEGVQRDGVSEALTREEAAEPILAILPMEEEAALAEAKTAAPPDSWQSDRAEPETSSAQAVQASLELKSERQTAADPPPGIAASAELPEPRKERIYAKASDYKYGPGRFAGATPGARLSAKKKGRQLPRALGKEKNGE